MAIIPLLAAALTLIGQKGDPVSLAKFIDSLHWDAAKSGPMMVVDPEGVFADSDKPSLADYKRKIVKTGNLSAIVPTWSIALGDDDIPNAYDALDDSDKLTFLIATLRPGELKALFTEGLCARDVSGQQRAAILSMLPKNFSYHEGEMEGGHRSSSSLEAKTVPDDQRDRVRLQIHKLLAITYGPTSNGKNGTSTRQLSTLNYRGPKGTQIVRMENLMGFKGPKFPGRVVDNLEKKTDLSWRDPRLAKPINLIPNTTIGDAVDAIHNLSGLELYADYRIADRKLATFGATCTAGDLLHGIAWALSGTIRKVGPAYVLTANIEGKASREARLTAIDAEGQIAIRSNVVAWRQTATNLDVYRSMPLSADDSFGVGSEATSLMPPPDSKFMDGWIATSELPQSLQSAVASAVSDDKENDDRVAAARAKHPELNQARAQRESWNPIEGLSGKVKLSYTYGYRLVLPDGRPFEYHSFGINNPPRVTMNGPERKDPFPIDAKELNPGGGIAIKSDDARTVASMCAQLKQFGVQEVWIETSSPTAIKSAADSGLRVDLVIRPWRLLKGESCLDPDRNVLGQTGGKLAAIPGARFDPLSQRVSSIGDLISPSDPGLPAHWSRLANLAATKGVTRVVLMDTKYAGYRADSQARFSGGAIFGNGGRIEPGLPNIAPVLFEFGFATAQRLEFLRSHRIDPVDITLPQPSGGGPIDPYFDSPMFMTPFDNVYPGVTFPYPSGDSNRIQKAEEDWHAYLNDLFLKGFATLGQGLSQAVNSTTMEGFDVDIPGPMKGTLHPTAPFAADGKPDWKNAAATFQILSPLNVEDDQGHIDYHLVFAPFKGKPFCYDLTDISPDRVHAYLSFLFKPAL